jgi:carboxymethylenebutenolidase
VRLCGVAVQCFSMKQMTTIKDIPVYEVPPEGGCKGGLIVIHEVWGLTDHIKDVAERYAKEGYYVIAPNLLHELDIQQHLTPELAKDLFDPEKRNAAQPRLRELMAPMQTPEFAAKTAEKVQICFDWLYDKSETKQKVAIAGYCFGGTYSFTLAVQEPRLSAAIPYYGHANFSVEELSNITCPILAFYGEHDERLMEALPKLEEDMHAAQVDFTTEVYGDAGHAFFNDTNPFAYNKAAATDAWKQTLAFLETSLA